MNYPSSDNNLEGITAEDGFDIWHRLRESLSTFQKETEKSTNRGHNFRFVSQAQAVPTAKIFAAMYYAGPNSSEPIMDPGAIRAAIYDQSFTSQRISAFLYASRISCLDHASIALTSIDQIRGGMPLVLVRGLIERIALAEKVNQALAPLSSIKDFGDEFLDFHFKSEAQDVIVKALYGTRMDWLILTQEEIRKVKSKGAAYKKKDGYADEGAIQILNCIDLLDKRIPGTRLVYEILCEFLHPNVGDLYSATSSVSVRIDNWGTRHLLRKLSDGKRKFAGSPQLSDILSECINVSREVMISAVDVHKSIEKHAKFYSLMNKKMMHKARKKQQHLFSRDDLCPCLSGLTVIKCK